MNVIESIIKKTYIRDIIFLFLIIIIATFFNPNWAFAPMEILPIFNTYNDHWGYTGIMLDIKDRYDFVIKTYPDHFLVTQHGYIFERLSWLIPGAILYDLFPPIIANYLLKFFVYGLSIISIYTALRLLFGRKTGLFGALLLGSYAWFLRSAGWEYVDGIGNAYFLTTFALIVSAIYAQKKVTWRVLCFLTGIMLVNLGSSNIYWGLLTPHLALVAIWLNHRHHKRPIFQSLGLALLGMGVMVFIYGAISYYLRGEWIYLSTSLATLTKISEGGWQGWRDINTAVYGTMTPHYHVLPMIVLLVWLFSFRTDKLSHHFSHQRLLMSQLVVIYGILALSHHLIQPAPYLIMMLYVSYIIPSVFLALGGLFSPQIESLNPKQFRVVFVIIVILYLSPFVLSSVYPVLETWQNNTVILIISVFLVLFALLPLPKRRLLMGFASIVILGWMSSYQIFVFRADRLRGQEEFLMAIDAYEQIQSYYVNNGIRDIHYIQDIRFETQMPMPVPSIFYIDSYYMGRNTIMVEEENLVTLSTPALLRLSIGQTSQRTVLITRYPQTLNRIIENYLFEYDYQITHSVSIERHDMIFYMYFLSINSKKVFQDSSAFYYAFNNAEMQAVVTLTNFDNVETVNMQRYRWMLDNYGTLSVDVPENHFDPNRVHQFTLNVFSALEEDVISSLSVKINGETVPLTRSERRFEGQLSGEILNSPTLEIIFQTDRTSNPIDLGYSDARQLAVALEWVMINPIDS